MSALYFCIVALDMLGELEMIADKKAAVIEYVYAMQLPPSQKPRGHRGFLGSWQGQPFGFCNCSQRGSAVGDVCSLEGNLAMTYTALAVLKTLGDDLSRVNKPAIIAGSHIVCYITSLAKSRKFVNRVFLL
jgi:geranylgeranyl transferase type-1 subunit beta